MTGHDRWTHTLPLAGDPRGRPLGQADRVGRACERLARPAGGPARHDHGLVSSRNTYDLYTKFKEIYYTEKSLLLMLE